MEIDLTGMMQVKGVHHADARYGVAVSPHLSAIHHQHFFSFRLDFDVAGRNNRIREVEVLPMARDSANPFGTGFEWKSTILATESAAARDAAPSRSRFWVIESATANEAGVHPAYTLTPVPIPDLLTAPDAPLRRRGTFATHQFWASTYNRAERYPAGEFPGQDAGGAGLPAFIADDANLDGADVVVWYTAGMTHVPRPEEWPIMPVSRMRFELRPSNFVRTAR
jgi:primary-amine oxidase